MINLKIKKYIILLFIIIISVLCLTGCDNKKDETKKLKEKADSEIEFFDERISKIIDEILLNEYENNNKDLKEDNNNNASKEENNQNKNNNNQDNGNSSNNNNNNKDSGNSSNNNNQDNGNSSNNQNNNEGQQSSISDNKSEIKELNWEQMNKEIENIYSFWSVLAIDLNKLNIDNQAIIAFGENVNNVKLAIENKQENMLLESLANLYSYIPRYMSSYSEDSFEIAKKNIKYYIISGSVFAKSERWDDCLVQIEMAESEYLKLMNNVNYVNKNSYNVNKIYILLEELKNSISYKSQNVFLLKYKALIQEF